VIFISKNLTAKHFTLFFTLFFDITISLLLFINVLEYRTGPEDPRQLGIVPEIEE
jgi:hypothetical protein